MKRSFEIEMCTARVHTSGGHGAGEGRDMCQGRERTGGRGGDGNVAVVWGGTFGTEG